MHIFQVYLHIQGLNKVADLSCERLQQVMQAQTCLPLFTLPDQLSDEAAFCVDVRQGELSLSCAVKAASRIDAHLGLCELAELLQAKLSQELEAPALEVGGFVSITTANMLLDLIFEGPDGLFAVYRAGAAYALGDAIPAFGLQDPLSPLFEPGGLRKLSPHETWRLLNSDDYHRVWARSAALLEDSPAIRLFGFEAYPATQSKRKKSRQAA